MNIFSLILAIVIIGFAVSLITTLPIPMHPWFKTLIAGVILIGALVWLFNGLGHHTGAYLRW